MNARGGAWPLYALGGVGAALWGVAGWRAAHPPLGRPLAQAIGRITGVDPAAISIGAARLGWPARLTVNHVAAGRWAAARVELDLDPWAALRGHVRLERLRAYDLGDGGGRVARVERAEATLAPGRARVTLRALTLPPGQHWLGGLGVRVGEAGLELEGGALKRLAFAAGQVGALDQLAGVAVRGPDGGWLVRAARPGLQATARVARDELAGRATLDRLALAGLKAPRGVDLGAAEASGTVRFSAARGEGARAVTHLSLANLAFDHPALARRRIGNVAAALDGEVALAGGAVTLRGLRVGVGAAALVLDGRVTPGARFDVVATLPTVGCAALLAAVPRALVPHLDGLVLDGRIAGHARLRGDLSDLGALALDLGGAVGCRARSDAPLADVAALARPNAPTLVRHLAGGRPFPLTPRNPSWRALATLPPRVVRAFLVAEDGRFFVHHGFDLDRIGRALAVDLGERRIDRGASTITQQVAKNLWLSGERTIGRKLEEAVLAWRLEQVLDKRRILELYLNLVELGPGTYGVQDGAERYFGKLPDELSADEAAQLAALLPAPRRGMDAAWHRRYRALAARLPVERIPMPPPPRAVKLTRR